MVEVFKTNVPDKKVAQQLLATFKTQFPECRVNFDLEDCDRILRVESEVVNEQAVMKLVRSSGFECAVLE